MLQRGPARALVLPDVVVEEPEDADPVPDVPFVAVLPEAREEVVEVLQPVLQGLVHPLDEVLPFDCVDVVLEPEVPARLWVPDPLVGPDGLPPVPVPQLPKEQVGVQDGLIMADAEPQEDPAGRLVGHPEPPLAPLHAYHGLVHEDGPDEPPVHREPVADGCQPLNPLPDGLVGPLHDRLKYL